MFRCILQCQLSIEVRQKGVNTPIRDLVYSVVKMRCVIPVPNSVSSIVQLMSFKTLRALAFISLLIPMSAFAAIFVPPGGGGAGIQAALDKLPEGGEVILGAGRYVVRQPILLQKSRQTLRGRGADTVLFLADGADCPVVILGALASNSKKPVSGVRLASLSGLTATGRINRRRFGNFCPTAPAFTITASMCAPRKTQRSNTSFAVAAVPEEW